jgi:hypothetical protein
VRRATFLVGRDGTIRDVVSALLSVGRHERFLRNAIEVAHALTCTFLTFIDLSVWLRTLCSMNTPTLTWRLRRIGGGLWAIAAARPRAWLLAPRLRRLRATHPALPRSTLHGDEDAPPMPERAVLPNVDSLPSSER